MFSAQNELLSSVSESFNHNLIGEKYFSIGCWIVRDILLEIPELKASWYYLRLFSMQILRLLN
jgi:hypothetical protein